MSECICFVAGIFSGVFFSVTLLALARLERLRRKEDRDNGQNT